MLIGKVEAEAEECHSDIAGEVAKTEEAYTSKLNSRRFASMLRVCCALKQTCTAL